jgi:hypothetical protein
MKKFKFWLLLICLISLFLFSHNNIVTAEEGEVEADSVKQAVNEPPKFVVQGDDNNYGFTDEETEKIKVTGEKFEFQVSLIIHIYIR